MKKKFPGLAFFIISLIVVGCDDFLTLTPESEYSTELAYKNQDDFEQAIAGIYSKQQELFQPFHSWYRGTIGRSDDTRTNQLYLYGIDIFTDDATNPWSYEAWQRFWQIINRTNLIFEKIDEAEFRDLDMKEYIKGEAYIYRAYAYWSLACQYGGMPLIDKTRSEEEVKEIARSTTEETFAFAANDYKKAIELLPDSWNNENMGRATKYAAEGMLARLYLFQNKHARAKPLLNDILSSGLYAMEPNYVDCFTDSKGNGRERVWEVQFTGGQLGEGQGFSTSCLPEEFNNDTIMPFSGYSGAMLVTDSLYNAYEAGDIRRVISILKGWESSTGIVDKTSKFIIKFTHYDNYKPKDKTDWAINLPILRYTDVKMMYAEVLNHENYITNGEAFEILNEVRTRAGLEALSSNDLPDQESFQQAVINERRLEFAFEGLRWSDMVRWGIAKEMMNRLLSFPSEGGGIYSMEDYQVLLPIPYEEILRYNDESVMWQNPGY
jgi:tetratricopeptide (TPR) repeat protein